MEGLLDILFGELGFICFLSPMAFLTDLIDQVTPFIYINLEDEVYHLVRVRKVLGDMK